MSPGSWSAAERESDQTSGDCWVVSCGIWRHRHCLKAYAPRRACSSRLSSMLFVSEIAGRPQAISVTSSSGPRRAEELETGSPLLGPWRVRSAGGAGAVVRGRPCDSEARPWMTNQRLRGVQGESEKSPASRLDRRLRPTAPHDWFSGTLSLPVPKGTREDAANTASAYLRPPPAPPFSGREAIAALPGGPWRHG